jgi:acyl-CoA synthetase (AMP-forming)/AMP-acid ligase II
MEPEPCFTLPRLTDAVSAAIAAHGARPAVSRGDETWTYRELGQAIADIERGLAAVAGPILYAPSNSPGAVATILGAVAAGRVPVLADPTWTDAERVEVARRCGIRTVITETAVEASWLRNARPIRHMVMHDVGIAASEREDVAPRPDTAFCRFTSGTTGFSRCLEFTHAAALAAARGWWHAVRYATDDVVLCLATLNNGLAFNTSLLAVLVAGGHLVFHAGPIIPSSVAATSRRFQPTSVVAFPLLYDALARARHRLDSSRLRLAVSSAAPLKAETGDAFRIAHGVAVSNYYGLVEAGPCTFNDGSVPGSVGYRLDGVDLRITHDGSAARLCVRSAAMASGFLDRHGPPLSASLDADGYYVTNDLAELGDNGHLFLRGRLGRLINLEGRKIDPGEIESVIRAVDGVTDALVREETANGRALLAAYVESSRVVRDELASVFRHRLAPYKRPQRIRVLPRFPRSSAGKILFNELTTGEL